jgi:glycerophosphoryl diester phosphodiesterase
MLIYAHRGASSDFPEMSRAAYLGAIEQGADGFECDLRLTKDRHLICWHDDDLSRIAGSPLVVARSTLEELRAQTEILTFDELLTIALAHKKDLALETKHPVPTGAAVERALFKVLDAKRSQIESAGIDIAIMSFSWWAARRARKAGYSAVYLIAHRWQRIFNTFDSFDAIGPGIFLLRNDLPLATKLARSGQRIFIWTVNTEADLKIAHDSGAAVVMSDKPGEMKNYAKWLKP